MGFFAKRILKKDKPAVMSSSHSVTSPMPIPIPVNVNKTLKKNFNFSVGSPPSLGVSFLSLYEETQDPTPKKNNHMGRKW
jgi:hypothetical protein